MSLPCPIGDLIPQKGKMGFAQTLIQADIDDSESTATIDQDNIFLDDHHQLSNIVLIEYINQMVAAVLGYKQQCDKQPIQKGLFVGLQDAEFLAPVHCGDSLTFKGFVTEKVSQVTFIQGMIYRAGEKIAQLVTKLYELEDFSGFDLSMNRQPISMTPKGSEATHQPPDCLSSSMHRKLYTYLQDTNMGDDFISLTMACPVDFDAFDGHFPENPILPGVILLEIGMLALEIMLQKSIVLKHVKKMKINGIVLPNQLISCTIKVDDIHHWPMWFTAFFKGENDREVCRFSGYCAPKGALNEGKNQ